MAEALETMIRSEQQFCRTTGPGFEAQVPVKKKLKRVDLFGGGVTKFGKGWGQLSLVNGRQKTFTILEVLKVCSCCV